MARRRLVWPGVIRREHLLRHARVGSVGRSCNDAGEPARDALLKMSSGIAEMGRMRSNFRLVRCSLNVTFAEKSAARTPTAARFSVLAGADGI